MRNTVLLSILATICCTFKAYATHMSGGSITYRYIDTLQYEVTVIYYRDCRGIPLNAGQLTVSCDGANASNITITRRSTKDITEVCSSSPLPCSPANTLSGKGIEEHTFIDTLDFSQAPLDKIKSCGGKIRFTTEVNARNNAVNTGPSGAFFTYAELDLKNTPTNSSPTFKNKPLFTQCANQPVFYNHSATDKLDGDSLSFEWAPPLRGWSLPLSYSGRNYSFSHPFDVYYPGLVGPPYVNPNANPPIGLYLDPETGDIIYTPTRIGEVTVAVIKVREWRKDTNGVMQNISSVHRDIQVITETCPDNNPPVVKGPYSYTVCEGNNICFNIASDDRVFVPPPPASPPAPDTVVLTWDEGIEDASFTIINPSARLQTGRFCWTPDSGTARSAPYMFTVKARDDACPLNGQAVRSFSVRVKQRAKAMVEVKEKNCDWYELTSVTDSTIQGTPIYHWTILDSNQNIILDSAVAFFKSTGNFLSIEKSDSIKFNRTGTYIIQHDINNSPVNCPSTYFDTVVISPKPFPHISIADTSVCPGSDVIITAQISGKYDALTYQWYVGQDTLVGEDSSSISLRGFDSDSVLFYRLVVTDTASCKSSAGITIVNLDIPKNNIQEEYTRCYNDTLVLELDFSSTDILWSPRMDTTISIQLTESTLLDITFVDSLGCKQSAKSNVIFNALPKPVLNDSDYCASSAVLDPGEFSKYVWSDASDSRHLVVRASGIYTVEVVDSNGCKGQSTVSISLNLLPEFTLGSDTAFCGDSMVYALPRNHTYTWNTGDTTSSITVYSSGEYWATLTDTNGCEASDTVKLELYSNQGIPVLTKMGDSLFSNQSGRHKWFRDGNVISGQFGTAIRLSGIGNYSAIYIDDNDCLSDTSDRFTYTASIYDMVEEGIAIYPNPSNGVFYIKMPRFQVSQIKHIKVIDAIGEEVSASWKHRENNIEVRFDYPPGVYYLYIESIFRRNMYKIINQE